jgi:acyl-CoA synthetase (AMP-forming)/AMP-acid ligase II
VNTAALLAEQAACRPDAAAIVEASTGRTLSFAGLEAAAAHTAGQLRARGVGRGDAVLVIVPMSARLYVLLAALFRIGAVAVFPDPSAGRDQIDRCCQLLPARAFVGTPKAHLLRGLVGGLRRIPVAFTTQGWIPGARVLTCGAEPASRAEPVAAVEPDWPALVTFTSGSTGIPKAAVRSHGVLLAQQRAVADALALTPGAVDLATLPIFVLANLAAGVTSVLPDVDVRRPGAVDPRAILATVQRYQPSRAAGSPALFERLIAGARDAGAALPSFERIFVGGAPVFPGLLDRLAAVAPRARVVAVYGSTEAEPIADIDRADVSDADRAAMIAGRGLLTGRPVTAVRVVILPDRWGQPLAAMRAEDFAASCLTDGSPGEIVVTGAHVLPGYLHGIGDEETKCRVGDDVWHRTGDAGWIDEHGRIWLLGRCAARVSDARGAFYPFSVECAAVEILGVRRAAAVAVRGRRVLALELHPRAPAPDLNRLAGPLSWACLDDVRVVARIPVDRRHNAKVDYAALARMASRW